MKSVKQEVHTGLLSVRGEQAFVLKIVFKMMRIDIQHIGYAVYDSIHSMVL